MPSGTRVKESRTKKTTDAYNRSPDKNKISGFTDVDLVLSMVSHRSWRNFAFLVLASAMEKSAEQPGKPFRSIRSGPSITCYLAKS